jgi:hypothetical protein
MKCPLLNKDCIEAKCAWWTTVTLKNIHTQELYSESKCVVNTIGPMLVDLIKNTGGVQAAVESSRNESVLRQDAFLKLVEGRTLNP